MVYPTTNPMPRKDRAGKVEVFLIEDDIAFFDDLRGDMSRAALATILIAYGLENAEKALAYHGIQAKKRHQRDVHLEV